MKFSSIKEYFYKLQSMCYALSLFPLAAMIALYAVPEALSAPFIIADAETVYWLQLVLPVVALIELTTVHWVIRVKLNKIIPMPSLGDRLDQFVPLAFIRTVTAVVASLLMLVALFLTGNIWFTGYAVALLLIVFLQRPTPTAVVSQLQLRGNEKELILKGELV